MTDKAYEISDEALFSINDLINDKFDITFSNNPIYQNRYEYTVLPCESVREGFPDTGVSYKLNSEYFRSDEFSSTHNGTHVLFAGCSNTEGVGGNVEDSWPFMVKELLEENGVHVSGLFNIGKAGYGWQKIINSVRVYVDRYGSPDILFVLVPNIVRYLEWDLIGKRWNQIQKYPPSFNVDEAYIVKEKEHMEKFADFVISWKLFEEYCSAKGIHLVWTTWHDEEFKNFNRCKFKNYFPISQQGLNSFMNNYYLNNKIGKFDLEKRDGHLGVLHHKYWAESFVKAWKGSKHD